MLKRGEMENTINIPEDSYTIYTAKSVEEIEHIRDIWEEMQWHPNADIDFYLTIVNSRKEIIRPHVLLIKKNGKPDALVIGRIEDNRIRCNIGYKTVYKPEVRYLTIIYGGLLGISDINSNIVVSELYKVLKEDGADVLYFDFLNINKNLYKIANNTPGYFYRDFMPEIKQHWRMSLAGGVEGFFERMNSKRRHEIRRITRKFEREQDVQIKRFEYQRDVEQLCIDGEEISRKTYQWKLGVGFAGNFENRNRLKLLAEDNRLLAYVLYVQDAPCAFWIGSIYKDTLFLAFTGYDPIYRQYEPGTILFVKMIEDICLNNTYIKDIDFGFGDAFYKQRFGTTCWKEGSLYLFAPSIKGMRINAIRSSVLLISKIMQFLLKKTKFEEKIKRHWRKKLTERKSLT